MQANDILQRRLAHPTWRRTPFMPASTWGGTQAANGITHLAPMRRAADPFEGLQNSLKRSDPVGDAGQED